MQKILANITANTPNLNGRIYPTSVLEDMVEQSKQKEIFVTLDNSGVNIELNKVIGKITNMELKDGKILAEIKMLNTPAFKIYEQMENSIDFVPFGTGELKDNVVYDYTLIGINVVGKLEK